MRCSHCKKESDNLILGLDAASGEKVQLCYDCFAGQNAPEFSSLEALDEEELEIHNILKKAEILEDKTENEKPDNTLASEEISPFLITPGKVRKMLESRQEQVRQTREKLLASMSEDDILKYRLRQAIALEDYEEAARLKKTIEEIQKNSGNRQE